MSELKNFIQNATSLASNGDIISSSVPYPKVGIETLTNKRHPLNNKPIYTIAYSGTSTGTDIVIPTGLTNIEYSEVISHVIYGDSNTMSGTGSYHNDTYSENRCYIRTNGSEIVLSISDGNVNYDNNEYYIVIEYTKTADTSTSPIVSSQLSLAEPYSKIGEETLTGKRHPVTGKPVYTQTFRNADTGTTYDGTIATNLTGVNFAYVTESIAIRTDGVVLSSTFAGDNADNSEYRAWVNETGTTINYKLTDSATHNNVDLIITLEYTKTADTNTSPIASLVPVKETGEVLQVRGIDDPTEANITLESAKDITGLVFTPKSTDSKLFIYFNCRHTTNSGDSGNSNVHLGLKIDGVTYDSDITNTLEFGSTIEQGTLSYEIMLDNTDLSPKTFTVTAYSSTNSVYDYIGRRKLFKITEVQN